MRKAMALSKERSCAEALMMACDERLGAQSPAALMVCDTFLARDFWTSFVHQSYHPPAASQVWAWGDNEGQLGTCDRSEHITPTEVTALHGRCIHAVACGTHHTMAVVDDGELWATGSNHYGQLGLGDTQNICVFTRVSGLSGRKVAAVACGGAHTLALLESGELFACGCNNYGQAGVGHCDFVAELEPVVFSSPRSIAAIACGSVHSLAVLGSGELFAWGCNNRGELGLGDANERHVPTQVTALAGRRVVVASGGNQHTAVVLESGEVFTWGHNMFGQLGLGDHVDRDLPHRVDALGKRPVKSVSCGDVYTVALLKTGTSIFSWGWNETGQLGIGKAGKPVCAPQHVPFFEGKRIVSISCGSFFTAAVLKDGKLFTWGHNMAGQLGLGNKKKFKSTPVQVGALGEKHIVLSAAPGSFHCVVCAQQSLGGGNPPK